MCFCPFCLYLGPRPQLVFSLVDNFNPGAGLDYRLYQKKCQGEKKTFSGASKKWVLFPPKCIFNSEFSRFQFRHF